MNILHLTTILPSPIKNKIPSNDILLRIAEEYERKYSNDNHYFILILPYTFKALSYLKPKWLEYYQLNRQVEYNSGNRRIFVIGIPAFRYDLKFRHLLTRLGFLANRKKIQAILEFVNPDLIHAHNMGNNMELAEILRQKFEIKFILSARNVSRHAMSRIKNGNVKPKSLMALNYISAMQCESFLSRNVHILPHPVEKGFFIDPEIVQKVNKPVSLVTVSSLLKYKNIDKVLLALSKLKLDYNYTIIGDGPERDYLKHKSKELAIANRVNFMGQLPFEEVKEQLKQFDLFILTSYPETLGRVYFQAMASGLPLIACKNTGVDGIIKNGVHGFLINPTAFAISEALYEFMQMPSDKQCQMKREAIMLAKNYSWDIILEQYFSLYHGNMDKNTYK